MAAGSPRRRRLWHAVAVTSATLAAICLIGWCVSLFRGDMVFLRVTRDSGFGFAYVSHRVAIGWAPCDSIPPHPSSRVRWQPLANSAPMADRWVNAAWEASEIYLLVPWAVPITVVGSLFVVARSRARRDAARAFEVLPRPPTGPRETPTDAHAA